MFARVVAAAVIVLTASGGALAETAAPHAAGTATVTTKRTPDSGAGASGDPAPAASVGGGIIGSDAVHGTGAHVVKGLSPKPGGASSATE